MAATATAVSTLRALRWGIVPVSRIIDGRTVQDGDVVVGFRSAGLHSNGYTLARKTLLINAALTLDAHLPELGCTLAEELLRPTHIYVRPVLEALSRTDGITGLAHITGDSFLNLLRLRTDCGFELTDLPPAPPVFGLIQRLGNVARTEMYEVFNMGVGFCVVCRPAAADAVLAAAQQHGFAAQVIGAAPRRAFGAGCCYRRKGCTPTSRAFERPEHGRTARARGWPHPRLPRRSTPRNDGQGAARVSTAHSACAESRGRSSLAGGLGVSPRVLFCCPLPFRKGARGLAPPQIAPSLHSSQ